MPASNPDAPGSKGLPTGSGESSSRESTSGVAGWVLAGAVLLAGLLLALLGEDVPAPLGRGSEAPNFTLPSLDGAPIALADHSGQVVLLNFWATWCKPCEDEMPAMERLYQRLRPAGFELLAVSVDTDAETVRAFRERLAISFPIALDPRQEVARTYQTAGFPESLLIDSKGQVVERYIGPRAWDDPLYVKRVEALLKDRG